MTRPKQPTIAVVGATGLVGHELLRWLEIRRFPVDRLIPFSSGRERKAVRFRGKSLPAPAVSLPLLKTADLIFMVSSDDVSLKYGRALAARGSWVIDDSSAFRLDPDVPLIIPGVNENALSPTRRLIAGPNCTLTGAAVAGYPLIREAGARSIHIASYQAVSGAGKAALDEFTRQVKSTRGETNPARLASLFKSFHARALPRPIAFNVFPQVGSFDRFGNSSEETKVASELRKIFALPSLPISVTAVRVPVLRGHSLSFWLETKKPLTPAKAKFILNRNKFIRVWRDGAYPTPHEAQGTAPVHVGRVRQGGGKTELCLWVVSDNLLKGAALNSIQIAEILLKRGWLGGRA